MNEVSSWQDSLLLGLNTTVAQVAAFLPRILAAGLVFLLGVLAAKMIRRLVINGLGAVRVSRLVDKTPMELFLKNAELGEKLEEMVGGTFYWLVLFLTFYTTASVLGLSPLVMVFEKILSYLPHILSAFFIFLMGVLLAGFAETLIKGTLKTVDIHSARLFAKVASYLVVTIASLAAISELGIASQFITILFVGVVLTFALGVGLAVGLGGQDTVRRILDGWYKRTH